MILDEKVLHSLTAGEQVAFKEIYDRYWKTIYQASKRFLKSTDLAKDVVQETFSAVWHNRANLKDVKNLQDFLISTSRDATYKRLKQIALEWKTSQSAK